MKLILQGSGMKLNDSNQLSSLERQCIGLVKRLHKAGIVSTDLEKSLDLIDKEYTRDFLNFNVHGPGIIKATPLQLEALASKGMRSFIQLTINDLILYAAHSDFVGIHRRDAGPADCKLVPADLEIPEIRRGNCVSQMRGAAML